MNHHHCLRRFDQTFAAQRNENDGDRARTLDHEAQRRSDNECEKQRAIQRGSDRFEPLCLSERRCSQLKFDKSEQKKSDAQERTKRCIVMRKPSLTHRKSRESDEPQRCNIQIDGREKRKKRRAWIRKRNNRECATQCEESC